MARSSQDLSRAAVEGERRRLRGERRGRFTRPQKAVLALALLVFALGLGNLGRLGMALRYAALLPDLPMTVSWTYLAAVGGLWGVVLTACAVGMGLFRSWGRWATLGAVALYQAHVWVDHMLFGANDYARQSWPLDLALTLLLLALVWGLLSLPRVRRVFE